MPTYEDFMSMNLIDMCVPKKRFKEVQLACSTCDIANCERSSGYRSSVYFWKGYNEMQRINEFLNSVRKTKSRKNMSFELRRHF